MPVYKLNASVIARGVRDGHDPIPADAVELPLAEQHRQWVRLSDDNWSVGETLATEPLESEEWEDGSGYSARMDGIYDWQRWAIVSKAGVYAGDSLRWFLVRFPYIAQRGVVR